MSINVVNYEIQPCLCHSQSYKIVRHWSVCTMGLWPRPPITKGIPLYDFFRLSVGLCLNSTVNAMRKNYSSHNKTPQPEITLPFCLMIY